MADPVVALRGVEKAFNENEVLKGISLTLPKGTTLAVMGGSGTGKTVLLRLIAGLIRDGSLRVASGRLVLGPKAEKRFGRKNN